MKSQLFGSSCVLVVTFMCVSCYINPTGCGGPHNLDQVIVCWSPIMGCGIIIFHPNVQLVVGSSVMVDRVSDSVSVIWTFETFVSPRYNHG